jgi:hypothetical protein
VVIVAAQSLASWTFLTSGEFLDLKLQKEGVFQQTVNRASSTVRCQTIQGIDSSMLPWENQLFGCARSKPSRDSVPAGLALASEFGFRFQSRVGWSLVLR